ncbi:hypothetical protein BH11MYX2_BH11MYX2_29170 [soil metagenome]
MTVMAALRVLVARYSGQPDLVLGTLVANRTHAEIQNVIGMFANTIALRNRVDTDDTFASLVARERVLATEAYANQQAPFELVVEQLVIERNLSRSPVFQARYQHEETPNGEPPRWAGLAVPAPTGHDLGANFDLSVFSSAGVDGALTLVWNYNTDLFDRWLVEQMATDFRTLVETLVTEPRRRLAAVPMLAGDARRRVLIDGNATGRDYDPSLIPRAIETQVDRTPEAIALVFDGAHMTYRELDVRANQLANHLLAHCARADEPVVVLLERSFEMVIALVGIMKAGAPYLPVDPTNPPERIATIVAASRARLIVHSDATRASASPSLTAVCLDDSAWRDSPSTRPSVSIEPASLAYVIFTSGSTGVPKGVMNTHAGLRNRLAWMQEALPITDADTVLQKTPYTFDVSVWELFWPLSTGARLVIAKPEGHKDAEYLAQLMLRENVTTLHFVPSMLEVFLEHEDTSAWQSVRQVICSGEALAPAHVARFHRATGANLVNLYGPTEAAIDVSIYRCRRDLDEATIPIGRPIANTALYVLDPALEPVPVGVAGELYIGGVQLARGYLDRPDLTAERFLPDLFRSPGDRMYRTGDRVRMRPDGDIEYLGRFDLQVKLRGFRIELGEIEHVLAGASGVRHAVVVVRGDRLVAYVVGENLDTAMIVARAANKLPAYMVPSAVVVLDALPLSSAGKVDRKALPELGFEGTERRVAPRTADERALWEIWSTLLAREVGVANDFFALGGHSLLAIRLVFEIERRFGVKIPLRDFLAAPTIGGLASRIGDARAGGSAVERPPLCPSATRRTRLPAALRGVFKLDKLMATGRFSRHLWSVWIDGPLELGPLERALATMRERHALLRTRFFADDHREMLEVLDLEDIERFALLERADLTLLSGEEQERADAEFHRRVSFRALEMDHGEVMSVALSHWSATRHRLTVSLHNMVSDVETVTVYVNELSDLWCAFAAEPDRDPAAILPPAPLQYHHLADYLERLSESEVGVAQRAFWQARLEGMQPIQLPIDFPREELDARRQANAGVLTFQARTLARDMSKEDMAQIERFAERDGASVMSTLVAAMAAYLSQRSSQRDIAFITRLSHRYHPGLERALGFLVNPIVLRISTEGEPTFSELVGRTRSSRKPSTMASTTSGRSLRTAYSESVSCTRAIRRSATVVSRCPMGAPPPERRTRAHPGTSRSATTSCSGSTITTTASCCTLRTTWSCSAMPRQRRCSTVTSTTSRPRSGDLTRRDPRKARHGAWTLRFFPGSSESGARRGARFRKHGASSAKEEERARAVRQGTRGVRPERLRGRGGLALQVLRDRRGQGHAGRVGAGGEEAGPLRESDPALREGPRVRSQGASA